MCTGVFKETVEQGKAKPHIYDGADEEDELDAFVVEDMEMGSEGTLSGQNSIYPDLWKPWRRALIARKIGGNKKTELGEVPSSLNNLTKLNEMNLAYNNLTGPFPDLSRMDYLY